MYLTPRQHTDAGDDEAAMKRAAEWMWKIIGPLGCCQFLAAILPCFNSFKSLFLPTQELKRSRLL